MTVQRYISRYFDEQYYGDHHGDKHGDVAQSGLAPLEHFIKIGAEQGAHPNALFDSDWYQAKHGISEPDKNQLTHYIRHCQQQDFTPVPFYWNLDKAIYQNQILSISGWAFHEQVSLTAIQLCTRRNGFTKHYPLIHERQRQDVFDKWQHANASLAGFGLSIVLTDFKPDKTDRLIFSFADGQQLSLSLQIKKRYPNIAQMYWLGLRHAKSAEYAHVFKKLIRGQWRTLWRDIIWFIYLHTKEQENKRPLYLDDALRLIETRQNSMQTQGFEDAVEVIIPVYNGKQHLPALFASLKEGTTIKHKLIVVNDASTDVEVWPLLQQYAEDNANIELHSNESNMGFTKTVNTAAALCTNDFVILNSDVIVPHHWLERLLRPIKMNSGISSTTPFSNAATIYSFPVMNEDNSHFLGLNVNQLDHFFRLLKPDNDRNIMPTAVGFCMGINIEVWNKLGGFDADYFGKGYCEENDWCERAINAGYENHIVPNLYVGHRHGGSFDKNEKSLLLKNNLKKLQQRYPFYHEKIHAYISDDKLAPYREIVKILICIAQTEELPVLIIDHDRGGGANRYRHEYMDRCNENKTPVFVLYTPAPWAINNQEYRLLFQYQSIKVSFFVDELTSTLSLFTIHTPLKSILINHLIDFPGLSVINNFLHELEKVNPVTIDVAVHDYLMLCPSYNLINNKGKYCGLPNITTCNTCLQSNHYIEAARQNMRIENWREEWDAILMLATTITCYSGSSKQLVTKVFPQHLDKIKVVPHQVPALKEKRIQHRHNKQRLAIGVLGAINYAKGSAVIVKLAKLLLKENKTAKIIVIGTLNIEVSLANVIVTGEYEQKDLADLIEKYAINLCFFPSIWPETFSYVTAELMQLDMPIIAFDLGAPAERLRYYHRSAFLDIEDESSWCANIYDSYQAFSKKRNNVI